MKRTSEQNDTYDVLNNFAEEDRPRMKELWELSHRYAPEPEEVISEDEMESALQKVHQRMESSGENGTSILPLWSKWVAAAAAALLLIVSGYLIIPQTVSVPYGEMATLELRDGTRVELNSGSELTFSRAFPYFGRDVSLDGEAFFRVERDDKTEFKVIANDAVVEVTGTDFNVRSWSEEPDRQTEVSVASGSVRLYPSQQRADGVQLTSGMWSRWSPEMERPAEPKEIAEEYISGWRENRFIFDNKPLWKIFREIERRFDIRIQIEEEEIARQSLTTYYNDPQDVRTILEDISRIKGLRYSETANGYRVYR